MNAQRACRTVCLAYGDVASATLSRPVSRETSGESEAVSRPEGVQGEFTFILLSGLSRITGGKTADLALLEEEWPILKRAVDRFRGHA